MRNPSSTLGRQLLIVAIAMLIARGATARTTADDDGTLTFGRFGTVHLYKPRGEIRSVALFVSGDGGWHLGVRDMARSFTSLDALVVGIDIRHYLREIADARDSCTYSASDFEALGQYVEKKLGLPHYLTPVLIGYSSGATLVYATLVQAPVNTFRGAISMGFCPDLPLKKPFCHGNGLQYEPGPKGKGYNFLPSSTLETPWFAFQGQIDRVCSPATVDAFVAKTVGAQVIRLEKVGHGFAVQTHWMPQFAEAYDTLVAETKPAPGPSFGEVDVSDLPLEEVPASSPAGSELAVFATGDGGWATLDRTISERLAATGVPVVGWDSLQYYWTPRTPEIAANDLARILRHYMAEWNKSGAILIGYSFGADVLPFLVNRLPEDLRGRVRSLSLIGLGPNASFEFHLTDWLGGDSGLPTAAEIARLGTRPIQCFYGTDESDSPCRTLRGTALRTIELPGGHHLGGAYDSIAKAILGSKP